MGLFTHKRHPIQYALVVNYFAVKYMEQKHVEHLMHALKLHSTILENWKGSKFVSLTLNGDEHITMLDYVDMALSWFQHTLTTAQHSCYPHIPPKYAAKVQYASDADNEFVTLNYDTKMKFIQQAMDTFLHYSQEVDLAMLVALSALVMQRMQPTPVTMEKVTQFVDYVPTHPNVVITYKKIHSDASYLKKKSTRKSF